MKPTRYLSVLMFQIYIILIVLCITNYGWMLLTIIISYVLSNIEDESKTYIYK